jgi:hypothetical protein
LPGTRSEETGKEPVGEPSLFSEEKCLSLPWLFFQSGGKPEMENAPGSTSSPGLKSGNSVLHVVEREEKRHA